jgi:hypothetical protein
MKEELIEIARKMLALPESAKVSWEPITALRGWVSKNKGSVVTHNMPVPEGMHLHDGGCGFWMIIDDYPDTYFKVAGWSAGISTVTTLASFDDYNSQHLECLDFLLNLDFNEESFNEAVSRVREAKTLLRAALAEFKASGLAKVLVSDYMALKHNTNMRTLQTFAEDKSEY